jgi:hypothetical protein
MHGLRGIPVGALSLASVACAGPAVTGEWVLGSRDSIDYTIELLSTGETRLHEYYFGHDPARRDAVEREDSLAHARTLTASPRWIVRDDSLCVLGTSVFGGFDHECAPYELRTDGDVPVLRVDGESWPRYRAR